MSITDRIKSLLDNVTGEGTNENETQPKDEGNNMNKKELILKSLEKLGYSPEVDKDFEFTKQVKKETDIVLSICHSDASYSTGKEAKDLGVTNMRARESR